MDTEPETIYRKLPGALVSADLSGFTAMSEKLAAHGREGAERLTLMVNAAFTALIKSAGFEDGDVLKFGGDALLFWFDGVDAGPRAARACARMQTSLGAPRFAKAGLRMSVGAHLGDFDMVLGGVPDWRELVLLGKPVTRTVTLESTAAAGEVLISPELAATLPREWVGRRRDDAVPLLVGAVPQPRGTIHIDDKPYADLLIAPSLRDDVRALAPLGGEHRTATVVFLEVEGIDERLEESGGELFAAGIDALIRATQEATTRFGVQFLYTDVIADGVKLITTAGAPVSTARDEDAALRYALQFVHGDPYGRLKAGVNRGQVFAGFLGAEPRRTYTVMGDPVNLAARLMSKAEPGQVVVHADLAAASRAELHTHPLEPFLVKGKAEPIHAVVVEAMADLAVEADARTAMVGREAELQAMTAFADVAIAGHGCAVELVGAAGIGKSRLMDEVASDPRWARVITIDCQPYDVHAPYAAAEMLVRRAIGIPDNADAALAGAALRTLTEARCPGMLPFLPLVATVAGASVEATQEASAIAPDFRVARTHAVVTELLSTVLDDATLIEIEDAYYADPASRALLDAIVRQIGETQWLVVSSRRPDSAPVFTDGTHHTVELTDLDHADTATLASLVAAHAARQGGGVVLDDPAIAALSARAGGNPLFVLQLVDAVLAGTAIEDLPESVERIVAERLDRLTPIDRTLVRHASVLGARFDTDVLEAMLDIDGAADGAVDPTVWDRLDDLVETDGLHHRFRHLLYRDAAYEGLPFARRRRLHQRVGEWLESAPGERDVNLLSEHFFRAGDTKRTWTYAVAAGDQAWDALAVEEAHAAYERALSSRSRSNPADSRRVNESMGDVLERLARYEPAETRYVAALRLTPESEPAAAARLMRKRGVLRERTGKYRAALRLLGRGLEILTASNLRPRDAELLITAAGIHHRLGDFRRMVDVAREAIDHSIAVGDRASEAHARMLAFTGLTTLDPQSVEGHEHGEIATKIFADLNDVVHQGTLLNNLGIHSYFTGDWNLSASRYLAAAALSERAGDVVGAAMAQNNLAEIRSDQGWWAEAQELFTSALHTWRRSGYRIGVAVATANLGRAHVRSGDNELGVLHLADAAKAFDELNSDAFMVETRLRLLEADLLAGRTQSAAEALDVLATDVAAGHGFPGTDAAVERMRCWLLRLSRLDAEALAAAEHAIDLALVTSSRFEHALASRERAILLGDPALAAQVEQELEALGVVALPTLPAP